MRGPRKFEFSWQFSSKKIAFAIRGRAQQASVAVVFALLPAQGSACEVMHCSFDHSKLWIDRATKYGDACSFTQAGEFEHIDVSGGRAVDIGGGMVGQRITYGSVCNSFEVVRIVDCDTGAEISVDGTCLTSGGTPMIGATKVEYLYPPHGTLRLTSKTRIPDIEAMAREGGYDFETLALLDVKARKGVFSSTKRSRNRIDPFCGCRQYYPESLGAQQ